MNGLLFSPSPSSLTQVRVWWVDGHISMCWPQDLYKCGEYDSEDGELWEETNSEASWETESEDTVPGEGYVPLCFFVVFYIFFFLAVCISYAFI